MNSPADGPIGEFSRGNCTDMQPRFVGGPLHNAMPRLSRLWRHVVAIESQGGFVIVPAHQRSNWHEYEAHEYRLVEWQAKRFISHAHPDSYWGEEVELLNAQGGLRFVEYVLADRVADQYQAPTLIGFQLDPAELLAIGRKHTGGHVSAWIL